MAARSEKGRVHGWGSRLWPWLIALATLAAPLVAEAAPIEGSASAGTSDQAIVAARRGALEQALASVDVAADPAAVADVLARAEAWTSAYRVLEIIERDGKVEVRIEVEVDLPRLRKRVAVASASKAQAGAGFRLTKLGERGCSGFDEATLRSALRSHSITKDGADMGMSLAITCSDRGTVSHTHLRAAAVEIVAVMEGPAPSELRITAQAFAESFEQANQIGIEHGLAELADALASEFRRDLELRVEQPWPAARVAVLERSLRESVIGIDSVELAGIGADGSVSLRLGGRLDAAQLGKALHDLTFPGFGLVGLRVDGHVLRVRMQ